MSEFSTEAFLTIPGVEVGHGKNAVGQSYHMVLVGIRQLTRAHYGDSMQTATRAMFAAGGLLPKAEVTPIKEAKTKRQRSA